MDHRKVASLTSKFFQSGGVIDFASSSGMTPQESIDHVCGTIRDEGIVAVRSGLEYRIFNIISFCSVVGSTVIFLTALWNPKLAQHPYKLVSMIALIDAAYFLIFNTLDEVCTLKFHEIFAYTVFFNDSAESQYRALTLIVRSSLFMFKTLFIVSFFLNSFLCIDLYLTVKSPFTPAASRLKVYYIFSFSIGILISSIETISYSRDELHEAQTAEEYTILGGFLIFIMIAIPSTIFASRRILRKGVSESVRREVISRHIKYIAILILTFTLYGVKIFMEDFIHIQEPGWLDSVSVYTFASQGLFLSLLRITEPLVWQTFKDMMRSCCKCMKMVDEDDQAEEGKKVKEGLNTFLASSFNVELVYIILKGIQKFTKELKAIEEGRSRLQDSKIKRRINKSKIKLKTVKIKNPAIWDVVKTEDFHQDDMAAASGSDALETRERELTHQGLLREKDITIDTEVKVDVHAPLYFKSIQQGNGITTDVLLQSLSPETNRDMVFKAGEGAGASGSFFFFSHDRRFIIKTMTTEELKLFLKMLPDYELHLNENPQSIISRIYGVYTIRMQKIATVHLMLMANTLMFRNSENIERIFDLKGSTVSREVKIDSKTKNSTTLKDTNYLKIQKEHEIFNLMDDDIAQMNSILKADVKFLKDHGIMDFSLLLSAERYEAGTFKQTSGDLLDPETPQALKKIELMEKSKTLHLGGFSTSLNEAVGARDRSASRKKTFFQRTHSRNLQSKEELNAYLQAQGVQEGQFNRHMFLSKSGKWIYHISIIDYLQCWNFDKKSEAFAKKWFLGKNAKGISAVPPEQYAKRFLAFMRRNIFVNHHRDFGSEEQ